MLVEHHVFDLSHSSLRKLELHEDEVSHSNREYFQNKSLSEASPSLIISE